MTTELATRPASAMLSEAVEKALIDGNIGALDLAGRLQLYHQVCADLGLNPRTRPFAYIKFPGGEVQLYALRNCTDQLAKLHHISQSILKVETVGDIYIVHSRVTSRDGRSTDNIGAVPIAGKGGDNLANAFKKSVTQAYRRAVLAHVGLSFLDETEVVQIAGAEVLPLDDAPNGQTSPPRENPEFVVEQVLTFCHDATSLAMTEAARDYLKPRWRLLNPEQQQRAQTAINNAEALLDTVDDA